MNGISEQQLRISMISARTLQRITSSILIFLLLLIVASSNGKASATTELVTNGRFDTDVNGWSSQSNSSITWLGSDGHIAPGAANVVVQARAEPTYTGARQCTNISTLSDLYRLSGWVKLPTQDDINASAAIRISYWNCADCVCARLGDNTTNSVPIGSDWTYVTFSSQPPSGTQSIRVELKIERFSDSHNAFAYFDDISLISEYRVYLPIVLK